MLYGKCDQAGCKRINRCPHRKAHKLTALCEVKCYNNHAARCVPDAVQPTQEQITGKPGCPAIT